MSEINATGAPDPDASSSYAQLSLDDVFSQAGITAEQAVDTLLLTLPQGARGINALRNAYYGINHRLTPQAIPINKDTFGLTFFTRPRLNLSPGNLRSERIFNPLTNTNPYSVQRIIRCYLDPDSNRDPATGISSPFVDPLSAFIPILTNMLVSAAGWPDITVPYTTSHEGVYKEVFSVVDGITEVYSAYDVTLTFRNMQGDPVTALFFYWSMYMSHVFRGTLMPYPEMIVDNEIDYQTRIYRLVLDVTKTRVQKIAACGAAFPYSPANGAAFNYDSQSPINQSHEQISIPMHCVGAIYQDPILLYAFDATVALFNPAMADSLRTVSCTKVPMAALQLFNHQGYPWINPDTWELEWWVDNQLYQQLISWLTNLQNQLATPLFPTGQNQTGDASNNPGPGTFTATVTSENTLGQLDFGAGTSA